MNVRKRQSDHFHLVFFNLGKFWVRSPEQISILLPSDEDLRHAAHRVVPTTLSTLENFGLEVLHFALRKKGRPPLSHVPSSSTTLGSCTSLRSEGDFFFRKTRIKTHPLQLPDSRATSDRVRKNRRRRLGHRNQNLPAYHGPTEIA